MHLHKISKILFFSLFILSFLVAIALQPSRVVGEKQPEVQILASIHNDTFGKQGRKGTDGADGRNGRNGKDMRIVAGGNAASYDVSGTNGEDGTDGEPGGDARMCQAPYRPDYSLQGANGGNGGKGGNGGNGGNGGDVKIYYTNPENLKKISLNNSGGFGGNAGKGYGGGYGCECEEDSWNVNYCEWELLKKPRDSKEDNWTVDSTKTEVCSGYGRVDKRRNTPPLPRRDSNWRYRWVYQGISHTKRYTCRSGKEGKTGNNGNKGENGYYGKVTLIPRLDIPEEKKSYYQPLSQLLGKNVQLVQNIWVRKQGLRNILNPASDIPDGYIYLQDTVRPRYRIDWEANSTPPDLDVKDVQVGGAINIIQGKAKIDFDVPGTLEYRTSSEDNLSILTVTGGFSPKRIESFQIQSVSGTGKDAKMVLVDAGDVRSLLKHSYINVTLNTKESATGRISTQEYQFRHRVKFDIPPSDSPSTGAEVSQNIYTIDVGRFFWPWLQPGYQVAFDVEINQTTKMGVEYTHRRNIAFNVPQS
ncbi:MAG: hypothetical protein QNJ47_20730 [Nostocaceae cyanobacterium]|nr:hypothetical protein [Nostocaceae cyanobacterium]